jgi:hypothetical protein
MSSATIASTTPLSLRLRSSARSSEPRKPVTTTVSSSVVWSLPVAVPCADCADVAVVAGVLAVGAGVSCAEAASAVSCSASPIEAASKVTGVFFVTC